MSIEIIAEAGVNHQGSFEKALRMVEKAKQAGATAVKFQKYNPVKVLGKTHPAINYAYQLSWKELTCLSDCAKSLGIKFGCSVFDVNDIPIVDRISDFHKIASRMNTNTEFISKIEECKKLTYMSIQPDMGIRIPERFKLLWCVREYPANKAMLMEYPYNSKLGLSSHCPDIEPAIYAISQGATAIEQHVCESREEIGCDIASSITFEELERMASYARMREMRSPQRANKNH